MYSIDDEKKTHNHLCSFLSLLVPCRRHIFVVSTSVATLVLLPA
jgi:hypothetical protein